jgi:energy-coupling factor transporter ATP-binding protein EcfA2
MLTKVRLDCFKRFDNETFELGDDVVLAGPNNSGKTTLLQAVATWFLALQRWLSEHAESSKAKQRTGVPVSRNDFTAIPLREMNLLWFDRDTAFSKDEREGMDAGQPKLAAISLFGKAMGQADWNLTVTLRYTNKEQIYVKLADESGNPVTDVPPQARDIKIVHVPPFSGIGAEETGLQLGYQSRLVGQGKPGDILRNLLLEVYRTDEKEKTGQWKALIEDVYRLFGYRLKNPQYSETTDPFIRIEYTHGGSKTAFDVASAGSGFHQVLTLLGFFYARPASVLLLDEPDAHLHVILQRQVYDLLRSVARRRGCQLLISTHSEIILEDTGPEQILSFYGKPHRLAIETDRDQVREALKRLSSLDILAAENRQHVLYVEDETDFKILTEFARILNHPFSRFSAAPFVSPLHGHDAREAKAHFFGLRAIHPGIKGVLLLDGDNRSLPDREIAADNLELLRWRRYEIENYLLHPEALLRFVAGSEPDLLAMTCRKAGEEFLRENFPPPALRDPLKDSDYLISTPASKSILPGFLERADYRLSKKDYFQIAAQMKAEEIHPEVTEKLGLMASVLNEPNAS